jgi:hypothetical protein
VDAKNAQIQELQNRPQEVTRLRHHRDSNTKYSDHAVAADSWGSKPNHKAASSSHTRSKTLSLGSQSRTLLGLEVPDGLNSPKLGQQQTRPVPEDSGHQKEPKSVL